MQYLQLKPNLERTDPIMKDYTTEKIRNIAVLGHGSAGKTTLCEALIYSCGEIDKIGNIADGSTVTDFDSEEKKRGCSISTAVYSAEYKDHKINLIDVPGFFDFTAGVSEGLTAADATIIALSGKSGLNVGSELNYESAKKLGKPIAFFVGKLNSPRAHFYMVMSQLTGKYGSAVCPITVPYVENDTVQCFVNLIENKAYKYDGINASEVAVPQSDDIENLRTVLIEAAASVDEALMEKYFEGEELTVDEIKGALKQGFIAGDIHPVFAGINQTGDGVPMLLDALCDLYPSPIEAGFVKDGGTSAIVFKTVADAFVGKLSYFKVASGSISSDSKLKNLRTGNEEKLSKVMYLKGGKQIDASKIVAGDIGCTAKLGNVLTGDTICSAEINEALQTAPFAKPCLSVAVKAVKRGDEEKINQGILRLIEEDPTISLESNRETKEQVLSGLGEQHLDIVKTKLKNKFGVEVELVPAKVAYRETIKKSVKVQGRHKKQSGGHGQFGDVWIEFSPCEEDFIFEEKIFGGSVPKNFFPAVEKGLRDSIVKGVLAGYPMVGVKATLVDGSYHPVDSSEMAFKTAAGLAYRAGIPEASPAILEPVGTLTVIVTDDYMGDVIGDITKRRGRVLGMDPIDNKNKQIVAEVPMAEMGDFAISLRSITQGVATFSTEFARYEEAPPQVAEKIIAEAKEE